MSDPELNCTDALAELDARFDQADKLLGPIP